MLVASQNKLFSDVHFRVENFQIRLSPLWPLCVAFSLSWNGLSANLAVEVTAADKFLDKCLVPTLAVPIANN